MEMAILIALITLPPVILFLLKSSPSVAFLSLCAGAVLASYATDDLSRQIDGVAPQFADGNNLAIALITLPVVLSVLLMRKSVKKSTRFIMQIIPALCVGILLALLVVDELSFGFRSELANILLWQFLHDNIAIVVAAGVITSLPLLWLKPLKRSPQKH